MNKAPGSRRDRVLTNASEKRGDGYGHGLAKVTSVHVLQDIYSYVIRYSIVWVFLNMCL